jgi:hypothetical protein
MKGLTSFSNQAINCECQYRKNKKYFFWLIFLYVYLHIPLQNTVMINLAQIIGNLSLWTMEKPRVARYPILFPKLQKILSRGDKNSFIWFLCKTNLA